VRAVNLVLFACVLKAATKEGRQLFRGKSAPPRENPDYAYMHFVDAHASGAFTCGRPALIFKNYMVTNNYTTDTRDNCH